VAQIVRETGGKPHRQDEVHQDRLRCGLQFVGLSLEQREKIRYWSAAIAPIPSHVGAKCETSPVSFPVVAPLSNDVPDQERRKRTIGVRRRRFYALLALTAVLAGFGWWRWQNAWNELEMDSTAATDLQNGLPLRVSPDTMDRQIVYKVDPVYPDAARQAGTQGLVVLDAVIAQDGTVRRLHPVAGPRVLAQSAVDAVRSAVQFQDRVFELTLDDAEEEIVILGAIEFGTEPADAQNEFAPDDDKMAEIITGKKKVRRPTGLEQRGVEPCFGQLVFIGINEIDLRNLLKQLRRLEKSVGF